MAVTGSQIRGRSVRTGVEVVSIATAGLLLISPSVIGHPTLCQINLIGHLMGNLGLMKSKRPGQSSDLLSAIHQLLCDPDQRFVCCRHSQRAHRLWGGAGAVFPLDAAMGFHRRIT